METDISDGASYILTTSIGDSLVSLTSRTNEQRIVAHLYGLVTRVIKQSRLRFIIITDGTAKIQLIAQEDRVGEPAWDVVKQIKESTIVEVTGEVGYSNNGRPSVFLTQAPVVSPPLPIDQWPNVTQIGHQIILAKVKTIISGYLDQKKFLEIYPKFLSTSWRETEVESLKVIFPGFGVPVHLVPTSATQLLRTIATTGFPKVYAVSKRFTFEHTHDFDGTECDVVMAKIQNGNLKDMIRIARDVTTSIFGQLASFSGTKLELSGEIEERVEKRIPLSIEKRGNNPVVVRTEVAKFDDELFGTRNVSLFAYYVPFPDSEKEDQSPEKLAPYVIVCDGAEEKFSDNLKLASLTIHIGRIARLILNLRYPEPIPDFRSLINVGMERS